MTIATITCKTRKKNRTNNTWRLHLSQGILGVTQWCPILNLTESKLQNLQPLHFHKECQTMVPFGVISLNTQETNKQGNARRQGH